MKARNRLLKYPRLSNTLLIQIRGEKIATEIRKDTKQESRFTVDARWRGLIRFSRIVFIISGIGGAFITPILSAQLFASDTPSNALSYLSLFSQHQTLAVIDWSLWFAGDFIIIPASISVYLVLRQRYYNTLALIGTLLSIIYVLFDMFVIELNQLTLVGLAQSYVTVANETADHLSFGCNL